MKILIADDDPIARCLLHSWATDWGYEVVVATNGDEAKRALDADADLRLAVIDGDMPAVSGIELCRQVRQGPVEPYTYLVLLSGHDSTMDIVEGLSAGADDYITKPCHRHELEVRLRAGRRILDLQEQLTDARDRLRHEAMHDSLTGVFNRAAVLDTLQREVSRSKREHRPLGVVMLDLDHFKRINDSHGHHVGDRVLVAASCKLAEAIRDYDTVGRIGGEEFLVVLPGCNHENASVIAKRLLESVRACEVRADTGRVQVSASLGVAASDGAPILLADALVRAADLAMYRAKRLGRSRIEVATAEEWNRVSEDFRRRSSQHPAVVVAV